jgi:hypothetical protein
VLLPSPSSLHYNKQKEGSGAKNVMAALLLLPSLLHCKKKKKVMAVLLPLPSSLCCNKKKKGNGAQKATATLLPTPSLLHCKKTIRRRCCHRLLHSAATKLKKKQQSEEGTFFAMLQGKKKGIREGAYLKLPL